jgi:hypothetical protein
MLAYISRYIHNTLKTVIRCPNVRRIILKSILNDNNNNDNDNDNDNDNSD